jgi:hypothetical protein
MTFFQGAVLTLVALNVWIIYRMLHRIAIAQLVGSFAVAHRLNPVWAQWFKENHERMLAVDDDDAKYRELSTKLAKEDPECPLGREALIACAFDAYKECRVVPAKYRRVTST